MKPDIIYVVHISLLLTQCPPGSKSMSYSPLAIARALLAISVALCLGYWS
jgi:hypothetical protein